MTMLYEDDNQYFDDMGGMSLGGRVPKKRGRPAKKGGVVLGGKGTSAGADKNPYITFLKTAKKNGVKFTDKEHRSDVYQRYLVELAGLEAQQKPKAQPKAQPKPKAKRQNKSDKYDVKGRLFGRTAEKPLRKYTKREKKTLNKDLIALGSGADMGMRGGRQMKKCPHCGGAWYDTVWDVVKTAAPYVAPLLL